MIKAADLFEWLKRRMDEEVYIEGDCLHCWSDDYIVIGDNEDEDDDDDEEDE